MFRKILAIVSLAALLSSPAFGFDTLWHADASQKVADAFGFNSYARDIMQLGNFAPDFFGPVAEYAAGHLPKPLEIMNQEGLNNLQVRQFAIFLHFDNLNSELDSNSKFDHIFNQLLHTTQSLLANYNKQHDLDERTRKILVLVTLGASLHVVQDFYSHSDWVHNDFDKTAAKMVLLPSGDYRAPTWFEFRDKAHDPDKWPFQVKTGIYPPVPGVLNTHTHMNHDNSRLIYKEYEEPGQPLQSQAPYHTLGPVPASEQNAGAVLKHQQLAVNSAIAASIEWVKKVEENGGAKSAIDSAKNWDLGKDSSKLTKELEAGKAVEMALSCAAGRWDGENPPLDKDAACRSVLASRIDPTGKGSLSGWKAKVVAAIAGLGLPVALNYTGRFWSIYGQYSILDQLASGIGSNAGHYTFSNK